MPKTFVGKPCRVSFLSSIKKFFAYEARRTSRFSIEIFLSRVTEELRRGTLLCFTKLLVSKNFLDKSGGGGALGREYHDFPSKSFVSQCLKVSLGNTSYFQ